MPRVYSGLRSQFAEDIVARSKATDTSSCQLRIAGLDGCQKTLNLWMTTITFIGQSRLATRKLRSDRLLLTWDDRIAPDPVMKQW
jgi:hypothetical protein